MRLKKDYVLRQVAETWVVLPLAAETVNFSGMLTLNNSGAMLWRVLEKDCRVDALVEALLNEYEVEEAVARQDAECFWDKLVQAGCLE